MQTHRTDANQAAIIRALRQAGATVCSLAAVGSGCPDLLVGWCGSNILLEVKNPAGRGMRFTPAELAFADAWRGRVYVVTDELQALEALTCTE
jgi:Holliday junction resolvase